MSTLTYEQAAQRLLEGDGYLILTHVRPDGDTVGCAAALCTALREQGKEAYVLPNPELTAIFAPYLEGLLAPEGYQPKKVVSVDMAARGLFPENAQCYLEKVDLAFDHHPSQEFFAKETCLDAGRAACGELMYDVIRQWGSVSQAVALPLYVAVSTDTGCFVYSNTSPATHAVAAALLETGIDFYPINRRHFRTRSLKRLKLEGMLTSGMEVLDEGKLAIVTLTLDMIAQVEAKEEDLDDISAFVGGVVKGGPMPNGIIVIDKPQDWTASEHALLERPFAKAKGLIQACGSSFSRRTRFAGLRREERGACYA